MVSRELPMLQQVLDGRMYIAQGIGELCETEAFRKFETDSSLNYSPLCDDFGPMSMASIINFTRAYNHEIRMHPDSTFFYVVEDGPRSLTNAVFLVGSYMILQNKTPEQVNDSFSWLHEDQIEGYRDATHSKVDFRLTLLDCWRGLAKGKLLGWVDVPTDADYMWGEIDFDEYIHYDDPLNGDMHEVVPGKLIAFRGPKDLRGATHRDHADGFRDFAPAHYADVFADFGVELVVRLNEPEYAAGDFESRGVRVLDLGFEDCAPPPLDVVDRFLGAVAGARGAVAVHCKAGLGRTGTLAALYLMAEHGFRAREAMGWLRVMRPGSVIGEQQHFLCDFEAGREAGSRRSAWGVAGGGLRREASEQVAGGMWRRAASRVYAEV